MVGWGLKVVDTKTDIDTQILLTVAQKSFILNLLTDPKSVYAMRVAGQHKNDALFLKLKS